MSGNRTLFKNGCVLTVDKKIGNFPKGDECGVVAIAKVFADLAAGRPFEMGHHEVLAGPRKHRADDSYHVIGVFASQGCADLCARRQNVAQ